MRASRFSRKPLFSFTKKRIKIQYIVGAVMGSYDGCRGWVNHLAVDPGYQGQDLGSRLMQELENRLAALGCEKINLLIEPSNSGVQAFYGRLGFTADELIFMEKWIKPA